MVPKQATESDAPGVGAAAPEGGAVTLISVLEQFEDQGFLSQFGERDGDVLCFTCRNETPPQLVTVWELRRLEGASDPADMLAVVALRCPRCGVRGTLTLNFGPEATPGESKVLLALPKPPEGAARPPADQGDDATVAHDDRDGMYRVQR